MSCCEIIDVTRRELNAVHLSAWNLDAPKPASTLDGYSLLMEGWVIGKRVPVTRIEVIHEGTNLWAIPVSVRRDDVRTRHPEIPAEVACGFRGSMTTLRLLPEFEIVLNAVLEDRTRVGLATIRGRRRTLQTSHEPMLLPVIVTTLGRTGSTWLMRLLDSCPDIVAYRPFQYEPRVATYWIEVLWALSEPTSYLQQIAPVGDLDGRWWLGSMPQNGRAFIQDPVLQQWLQRESVEQLAAFCQERIEAIYAKAAQEGGKQNAVRFAEKYLPNQIVPALVRELYPAAREVLLVRDFRDMVSSILAFNAKRGYAAFGRERAHDDRDYIGQLRSSVNSLLSRWRRDPEGVCVIRYEDLILEPHRTMTRLLDHLELESDSESVTDILQRASLELPEMAGHRTSPESAQSVGRWRDDLDDELQDLCEEAFGPALEAFGYSVSGVEAG